jgi:hypothetical protein
MRTPREILFQRHRAAEAKLDVMRRAVVNRLDTQASARLVSVLLWFPRNFWLEVVWPARRIWAGLAAAWLLILMANLDLRVGTPQMAVVVPPNSVGFLMTLREQEQLMANFFERSEPRAAAPPKPQRLQPRTERRKEFIII